MFQATLAHHPAFSAGAGVYGNSRLRVGDYLSTWLKTHTQTKQLARRSHIRYEQYIRSHLAPAIGHVPLIRLSPQTIQDFYGGLLAKGLHAQTIRSIAGLLHNALNAAVRRGLVARNPVDQTDLPSCAATPRPILTHAQVGAYLEDAQRTAPPVFYAFYVTKIGTGMRLSELLGLRECDLNLDGGVVCIEQILTRIGKEIMFTKPKTDRSRRTVTLPRPAIDVLRGLRLWKREQRLRMGPAFRDSGLVFCNLHGGPIHPNHIRYRDHAPRLLRLKLPNIHLHDMRHCHASHLVAAGIDPRTVADRLGHSSPAFTMRTYVHGVSETQIRAAEAASKLLVPVAAIAEVSS